MIGKTRSALLAASPQHQQPAATQAEHTMANAISDTVQRPLAPVPDEKSDWRAAMAEASVLQRRPLIQARHCSAGSRHRFRQGAGPL